MRSFESLGTFYPSKLVPEWKDKAEFNVPVVSEAITKFVKKGELYREAFKAIKRIHLVMDVTKDAPMTPDQVDLTLNDGVLTFTAHHCSAQACSGQDKHFHYEPFLQKLEQLLS